ncbi:MAG: Acetyl-coenzyme A carboxyl transferase alpha chain [uncultured Gemmatimonadetes bacterium]|uniref:Acetyl-coenzyme A carboxylase carboxyl transferase subunit alpha n=1 Tax=uncultured Gemmatimonadota bacterium TaxID=203437 RepID=A0A6J4N1K5_9BACT|nr:MAG: Acetyl-coenzyme A carboxyl transferase alpha chain [uncultured Gemmatimonadota bacterium]
MATSSHLDFERSIAEVDEQITRLRTLAQERGLDVSGEIRSLERKLRTLKEDTFRNLSPIERVQVARHPRRPYTRDYLDLAFSDWIELHGDRAFRDDRSIIGGWARLDGESVMLIGQQKGRDMKQNLRRNFGMPHPEGYRKALRLMKLAEKFGRPIITLIDTPGAYPGLGAEERGQAEAIARNLREMAALRVPTVAVVIGEGGSGGALAIGVADRVLMLENSIYSVISPEGCAAILWKSGAEKEKAAAALKITAEDLQGLEVIDEVVPEPAGGAHSDWERTAGALKRALLRQLGELRGIPVDELRRARWDKYMAMGEWRASR